MIAFTTGSMNIARTEDTATLLQNGEVLVAGGSSGNLEKTAELYNPITGTWTLTGSMNIPRYSHTATLLPDGQVLVVGGFPVTSANSAELYDPKTGTWTFTGAMNNGHGNQTATLLNNGKVLIAGGWEVVPASGGGYTTSVSNSAELYDPNNGTWTVTSSMFYPLVQHTATLLKNGNVLVAGGEGVDSTTITSNAELYNPTTGTWAMTASMNFARISHTATLLLNGDVLVAGGYGGSHLSSAELYTPSNLDTTSPSLSLPGTITATDPDNQPSELIINCSPLSGSIFPIGTTTVNCSASDPAGNTTTGSFQIIVKGASDQIIDLISLVNSFNLSHGEQTSLDTKLQNTLNALNINSTQIACSSLNAFINEVNAQFGKSLTQDQANQLISAATQIKAVLGC